MQALVLAALFASAAVQVAGESAAKRSTTAMAKPLSSNRSAASYDMYSWWCTVARDSTPPRPEKATLCARHAAILAYSQKNLTQGEKAALFTKLQNRTLGVIKEYSRMKSEYCISEHYRQLPPSKQTALCTNPATKYKKPPPSSEVWVWFCKQPANKKSPACKRWTVAEAARKTPSPDKRAELLDKLKEMPLTGQPASQDIVASFCQVPAHRHRRECTKATMTREMSDLKKWYCVTVPSKANPPPKEPTPWCRMDSKSIKNSGGYMAISADLYQAKESYCSRKEKMKSKICVSRQQQKAGVVVVICIFILGFCLCLGCFFCCYRLCCKRNPPL